MPDAPAGDALAAARQNREAVLEAVLAWHDAIPQGPARRGDAWDAILVYLDAYGRAARAEGAAEELRRRKFMQTRGRFLAWGVGFVVLRDDSWEGPYDSQEIARATYDGTSEGRERAERQAIDAGVVADELRSPSSRTEAQP